MTTNSEPTTALETLGTYLSGDEPRDAIHLAVVPLVASENVFPGQHLTADGQTKGETVGIVDPFLPGPVQPGQRFWLVLYPRTITGLRHVWTHPAFPESESVEASGKEVSEQWLRDYCATHDVPDYHRVVAAALEGPEYGDDYLLIRGSDAHADIPPEFWDHIEVVTGKKIADADRAQHFSCSC